eukprot:CAMPEP_0115319258 /NCGR_PEP_ID=MMETSP0270-20121206/79660_1 /TAXON_ID=71861 /ORGANISM="Scrippsiella trochoidea, Strain CCMP3099" /LENGTH=122 /DNA_ID=CAMNT_0002738919 /DNA_START=187 /DNA_END=552 /DNA_ORIENTATION=-
MLQIQSASPSGGSRTPWVELHDDSEVIGPCLVVAMGVSDIPLHAGKPQDSLVTPLDGRHARLVPHRPPAEPQVQVSSKSTMSAQRSGAAASCGFVPSCGFAAADVALWAHAMFLRQQQQQQQ